MPGNLSDTKMNGAFIQLTSGFQLVALEILLFDEAKLAEANALKQLAIKNLGGWASGIGVIGSLSQVITYGYIISACESIVSSKMQEDGLRLLYESNHKLNIIRSKGEFFPISQIDNITVPAPELWRVHGPTLPTGKTGYGFVHNGDPFIAIKDHSNKVFSIIWDKVELFYVSR
jgi:hypothetical protein